MTQTTTEEAAAQATISRDLSEFLVELSIGVHRNAMYPAGHRMLKMFGKKSR